MADEADDDVKRDYHWATPNSDGFNMWLDGEHVHAENKVMKLTEAQHKELNKLIRSGRPDIAQNVQYIDLKAAEEVAKAHMAAHKGVAGQGAHNSGTALGGKDPNTLKNVPKINIPAGTPLALAEKLKARSGTGNAATIIPNPDEPKKLVVIEEGNAVHPEDMTPEQILAMEEAQKNG